MRKILETVSTNKMCAFIAGVAVAANEMCGYELKMASGAQSDINVNGR